MGKCEDSTGLHREAVKNSSEVFHSALMVPTRWILGSPNFHPMAKLV